MTSKQFLAVAFAVLTVLSGAVAGIAVTGTAQAAPTDISSCTTIEEAGEYRLTSDVTSTERTTFGCIDVIVDDVVIDGNGYTVADDSGADNGILLSSVDNVTVRDLTVEGFDTGLNDDDSDVTVESSLFSGNGVGLTGQQSSATVEDSTFDGNTVGIAFSESAVDSANATYANNDDDAVTGDGEFTSTGDTFADNGRSGIDVAGDVMVTGATIENNGENGIVLSQNPLFPNSTPTLTVVDSVVSNNVRDGITVAEGDATVEQSTLADNGGFGVNNTGDVVVDATGNYWGASDGPSSETAEPLEDPQTGTLANGSGDAVSEDPDRPGVSNVQFDDYLTENPFASGDDDADDTDDGADDGSDDGSDDADAGDGEDSDAGDGEDDQDSSDDRSDAEDGDDSDESDDSQDSEDSEDVNDGEDSSDDEETDSSMDAYQVDLANSEVIETLGVDGDDADDRPDFYEYTENTLLQATTMLEDGTVTGEFEVPDGETTESIDGCTVTYDATSYDSETGEVTATVSVADDGECEGVLLTLAGYELPGDDTRFSVANAPDQELLDYTTVTLDAGAERTLTIDLTDDSDDAEN